MKSLFYPLQAKSLLFLPAVLLMLTAFQNPDPIIGKWDVARVQIPNNEVIKNPGMWVEFKADGFKTTFSDFGGSIDLVAPGVSTMVYAPKGYLSNAYATYEGTSASAPHISGVSALILSYVEDNITDLPNKYSPEDVETILQNSAVQRNQQATQGVWQPSEGFGLLQAGAALASIDKADYTILHVPNSQTSVTKTETVIGTDVFVNLPVSPTYSGILKCDIYKIEFSFNHSQNLNPGELVKEMWGRNSGSLCYGKPVPVTGNPNYTYEIQNPFTDFEWTFPSATSATAVGYAYYVKEVTASGVTFPWNKWSPADKSDIQAAYSVYIEKNTTTDVDDVITNNFEIYPNPANEHFFITFQNNKAIKSIELFSIEGKLIETEYVKISSTTWQINPTHTLVNGVYLLKIYLGDGIPVFKKVQIN